MLKYPCLVLDHDDTVVQSEKTIAYPCFCSTLSRLRPGLTLTFAEYVQGCHEMNFVQLCRERWQFTDEELQEEYEDWIEYARTNIPAPYPGIREILHRQKASGGIICVVSLSTTKNITRDYEHHFGIQPDIIYGCDAPKEQHKPAAFPLLDIMERYHLQPHEILVVDDGKLAWDMAHPLNIPFAFAAWGKREFPVLCEEMQCLSDFSFDSTESLEKFLFD